ncbi:ankyrin, partial [Zopfia rhizophila CBS 207.26]
AFRDYAVDSWYQHVTTSGPHNPNIVRLINKLFDPGNANWHSWRTWFDLKNDELNTTEKRNNDTSPALGYISRPLYYLSRLGLVKTVKCLIHEGKCSTKEKGSLWKITLAAAGTKSNLTIVQDLLQAGTGITNVDKCGKAPFHLAAQNGHVKVAQLLLENGAEVNLASKEGRTP